jgi:hypothetical protein
MLEYIETLHQIFIAIKKGHNAVRKQVLYSFLIEFGLPMKPVRLITICLTGMYSKLCIGEQFSVIFLSKMV